MSLFLAPLNIAHLPARFCAIARISSVVGALALCIPAFASRFQINECTDATGQKVFQDKPCGVGGRSSDDAAMRWSRVLRMGSTCMMRSPKMKLGFRQDDADVILDGGANLLLTGTESGVAASIRIDAAWPVKSQGSDNSTVLQPLGQPTTPTDASIARTMTNHGRRVELSPDISRQGVFAGGQVLSVDSMSDATRLSFGFGQTTNMLKSIATSQDYSVRLRTRGPSIDIQSSPLVTAELRAAAIAVASCVRSRR